MISSEIKNLFSVQGRQGRRKHFFVVLGSGLGSSLLLISMLFLLPENGSTPAAEFLIASAKILTLLIYFLLGPTLVLFSAIKRLNDLEQPRILVLLYLLPLVNLVFALYLLFQSGTLHVESGQRKDVQLSI